MNQMGFFLCVSIFLSVSLCLSVSLSSFLNVETRRWGHEPMKSRESDADATSWITRDVTSNEATYRK